MYEREKKSARVCIFVMCIQCGIIVISLVEISMHKSFITYNSMFNIDSLLVRMCC